MLQRQCWQWRHSVTVCCMLQWQCWQWRHSVTVCCMLKRQCWQWRHSVRPLAAAPQHEDAASIPHLSTKRGWIVSLTLRSLCPQLRAGKDADQVTECVYLYHGLKFNTPVAIGSSVGILLSFLVGCSSVGILLSFLVGCSSVGILLSFLVGCSSVGILLSFLVGCSSVGILLSFLVGL